MPEEWEMSEHSFGARQFKLVDIALHGHLQGTCQGFEDAFNLVVLVLALGLDVEVHAGSIRQTLLLHEQKVAPGVLPPIPQAEGAAEERRGTGSLPGP